MKKTIVLLLLSLLLLTSIASAYPIKVMAPVNWEQKKWVVNLAQCSETDGGKNYFVRGTLALFDPLRSKQIHISDECTTSDGIPVRSCSGSNCGILEAYCGGTIGYTLDSNYLCPSGCKSGACLPENRKMSHLNACAGMCSTTQQTCELKCPSSRYVRGDCLTKCKSEGLKCRTMCPISARP
ncbi:hypothetical protein J4211_03605 [Candidatus Woesearchaeota archaeon]|nr:hypothetical protein [Candidatus Woesearchaeota archaeon]